ncbi:MAG: DUF1512 family protein [Nanohaloarchaea archaeon]|nr:DUF1512 family protein [Candidatus Nanohaloarchaea archaeon]
MVLPFLTGGENNLFVIIQTLMSLAFVGLIFFFPKIMIWQTDRKLRGVLESLETYKDSSEQLFVDSISGEMSEKQRNKFESLKDFKMSAPTNLDPAGMVGKLEHVLDTSENKFNRFIEGTAETEDEEELADLNMAFKGVMGTHQIHKVMRHFRQLIKKTGNIQLVGMINMMVPIYEEIAEAQHQATRAFVDNAPIGDSIGPLVAAKMIESEPEEVSEDIIRSEEEIGDQKVHVIKSTGPGARLGKYGDAVDDIAEENDLEAIITVDAGAKFEGEETGSISEGVGVMMGGPGVEKTKIEEAATEHDVPLEGIVIKQSPPEASKPMKKPIYEAYKPAVKKVEEIVKEFDGEVAVIGVGNTCGVGDSREQVSGTHNKLRKYWNEYEEQEDDEVSYMGLMGLMGGGDQSELMEMKDRYLMDLPRS